MFMTMTRVCFHILAYWVCDMYELFWKLYLCFPVDYLSLFYLHDKNHGTDLVDPFGFTPTNGKIIAHLFTPIAFDGT
jgi:hypothetical protein